MSHLSMDWCGDLPGRWTARRLKYLTTCNDEVLSEDTLPEAEIQYVDIGGVSGLGRIETIETMTFAASPSRARRVVRSGDVLVSTVRTYLRAIAPVADAADNLVASTGFAVIRCGKGASVDYIGYALRTDGFVRHVIANSVGVSYPAINASDLIRLWIPAPPLDEQRQIARFLDYETARIDALIEKQEQLIGLLKEKRQAVISHAVTKGLNPDAPLRDSGVEWLGMVPAHWEVTKLHHLSSRIGDGLHGTPNYQDGTGFYFINGNNLEAGRIIIGESAKEVPSRDFSVHQAPLSLQTVLLSINGTIGKVALYGGEQIILGKSAAYINCLPALRPSFLMAFFESDNAQRYYELLSTGTTISNLSLDAIRQLKVGLPSLEEQAAIVQHVMKQREQYDALISTASKLTTTLQERRTALISAAVTGKIDVRGWKPPESNVEQDVA